MQPVIAEAETRFGRRGPTRAGRLARWCLSASLLVALGMGFVVGRRLAVRRIDVPLGLREPVRLAVLSDFHLGARESGADMSRRALSEAAACRPDAILLAGDFVASQAGIARIPGVFHGIRAPLGVYAVLGNHDHWSGSRAVEAALQSSGVHVLMNQGVELRKGRARLALVGVDDVWTGRFRWAAAWRGVPRGVPVVLLSHNPDAALTPAGQRAALIASGHTHGGTIRMPWLVYRISRRLTGFGLISHSKYGTRHPYGLMREKWGWVYVTSGVTPGCAPPRWYTRPEVAVVEVR